MEKETPDTRRDTRQAIIEAACELFASQGLGGTGVRAIVQAAGTALSSVNYHFENKEQLYEECIRYILHDKLKLEEVYSELEQGTYTTPQEISNVIYKLIRKMFFLLLSPDMPKWYAILLIRAKHELHPSSNMLIEKVTSPVRVRNFLMDHIPGMEEHEAFFWIFSLTGQLQHYIVSKPTVLSMFNKEDYDCAFLESIVRYSACNMIRTLNLPEPEPKLVEPETDNRRYQ